MSLINITEKGVEIQVNGNTKQTFDQRANNSTYDLSVTFNQATDFTFTQIASFSDFSPRFGDPVTIGTFSVSDKYVRVEESATGVADGQLIRESDGTPVINNKFGLFTEELILDGSYRWQIDGSSSNSTSITVSAADYVSVNYGNGIAPPSNLSIGGVTQS